MEICWGGQQLNKKRRKEVGIKYFVEKFQTKLFYNVLCVTISTKVGFHLTLQKVLLDVVT